MTEYLRVFKLSNGESIIGTTLNDTELFNFQNPIQISYPLKMVIVPKVTKDGVQEALTLSPWVHPMTKTEYIDINPNSVVMTAPASYGLLVVTRRPGARRGRRGDPLRTGSPRRPSFSLLYRNFLTLY